MNNTYNSLKECFGIIKKRQKVIKKGNLSEDYWMLNW
jgi:hypothetical protein